MLKYFNLYRIRFIDAERARRLSGSDLMRREMGQRTFSPNKSDILLRINRIHHNRDSVLDK